MYSKRKIMVCGNDSTFQYLAQQLGVMGYSSIRSAANPLDITFECLTQKPSAVFFSSSVEQPVKLVENLRKVSPSPAIFVVKSQRDVIPNKRLEEITDEVFYQPLDIGHICRQIDETTEKLEYSDDELQKRHLNSLHNQISDILSKLCVTPNYHGYMYLREAIKIAVDEPVNKRGFSTHIYNRIAKRCDVSAASVERNIRTAINKSWDKASVGVKNELFGTFVSNTQWRPTNSEFILIIADMINRGCIKSEVYN